jgi:hypothetical protein
MKEDGYFTSLSQLDISTPLLHTKVDTKGSQFNCYFQSLRISIPKAVAGPMTYSWNLFILFYEYLP